MKTNTIESVLDKIRDNYSREYSLGEKEALCQGLLSTCPKAGQGVHEWLFLAARSLHRYPFYVEPDNIEKLLDDSTQNCGRVVQKHEIEDAVKNSDPNAACATVNGKAVYHSKLPSRLPEVRSRIIKERNETVEDLEVSSSADLEALDVLPGIFPADVLLCFGKDRYGGIAICYKQLKRPYPQLMVPSPLLGWKAPTKRGNLSHRSLANIGRRWFLVVEFDEGSLDEQVRLLFHLAENVFPLLPPKGERRERNRLVMIVFSGNKSLHGWFYVRDLSEKAIDSLWSRAYQLGCCQSGRSKCQFVRTPGALRTGNQTLQRVLYFQPEGIA